MTNFEWTDFYFEFATSLLAFENDREHLIEKVKQIYINADMKLPTLEKENDIVDIDPFNIFGLFNKGITDKNRIAILDQIKTIFEISSPVPVNFDGIPVLSPMSSTFYHFIGDRGEKDIDNLWTLFRFAISYADRQENEADFIQAFDTVILQKGVSWNITIALYWIRPMSFINLDAKNRELLENNQDKFKPDIDIAKLLKKMVSADNYLMLIKKVKTVMSEYKSFPELSLAAWNMSGHVTPDVVEEEASEITQKTDVAKNTILYGPPGTGKTYNTVIYAVAIIENKLLDDVKKESYSGVLERYNQYKADGFIEFTTFHQSYGYEEFIEGIKPVMDNTDDQTDIQYQISSGLFKSFCDKAGHPVLRQEKSDIGINTSPTIWKVSLEGTGDNPTRKECMENGHIRIGYDSYGKEITSETSFVNGGKNVINAFVSKMKTGDIVLSCYSSTTIDAVGIVTGDYEWHDEYEHYKRLRKVNWVVKGIREDITGINDGSTLTLSSVYKLNIALADVMDIIARKAPESTNVEDKKKNYVFVIDEINRGNISKIFGELITLIESSKRIGQAEEMRARLPYSRQMFGVPDNVYIIGTMNTADRSIATIDTALRRRFRFKEMLPDASVLNGISIEGISISEMLTRMNRRISVLYDREHTIGHAYFIPLREKPAIEKLAEIFENAIIPLLQEYFYEDYEKIRLVLGDNKKDNKDEQFIIKSPIDYSELFGDAEAGFDDSVTYEVNHGAFCKIEAYRLI
mgnify:FL=1